MILLNIAFEVILADGNFQSFSFNDYKKARCRFSLEFLQQYLLVQGLCPGLASYIARHLKDVKNNHNNLLALTFLFTSISFKITLS